MSIAEPLLFPDPEVLSPQEDELLVSVVIPCLNEAANIERCVSWALTTLAENGIAGEVVVADNDSDDDSAALALAAGARVVHERRRGYGNAYMAGFAAAQGRHIVMADADLTYDFGEIPRFLAELETGADLVMGDRMDGIQPGAMPWLHRYIGNPLLSGTLNLFFRTGRARRPLRHARLPPREAGRARPAHHRHGVRLRDGDPGRQGEARHPPAADRLPPARRDARSSRASATAGATCASCSCTRRRTCS